MRLLVNIPYIYLKGRHVKKAFVLRKCTLQQFPKYRRFLILSRNTLVPVYKMASSDTKWVKP